MHPQSITSSGISEKDTARFWSRVLIADGCWLWQSGITPSGYGRFAIGKRYYCAHRIAYQLTYGPIPDGLLACHNCDIHYLVGDRTYRRCVRPDHLFLGTCADNIHDAIAKGRAPQLTSLGAKINARQRLGQPVGENGEGHHSAKLTVEKIQEIRRLHQAGLESIHILSRQFGVNRSTIQRALHGRTWASVPNADNGQDAAGKPKLTREKAAEIRRLRAEEHLTCRAIGARFGVAHCTVLNIIHGRAWKEQGDH